jgi:hypothetical protein
MEQLIKMENDFKIWCDEAKEEYDITFDNNLQNGEEFEMFVKEYHNKLKELKGEQELIIKLEYKSPMYYKYNSVDLVVYNNEEDMIRDQYVDQQLAKKAIDCKLLFTIFRKSKELIKLDKEKCACLTANYVKKYEKNTTPTFLFLYMNNNCAKKGYYFKNVKKIEKIYPFEVKSQSEYNKWKYNFDLTEFKYCESISEILK